MKKSLVLAMAMALGVTASAYAANPFSDVPAGHWAYDSISKLAAAGVIEGYGDTTVGGDKLMTRYEMAQIVAKAMAKGANVDKLAAEFADELDNLGVRVANLEKKADNVKITGYARYRYVESDKDGYGHTLRSRIWFNGQINDDWSYTGMIQNDQDLENKSGDEKTDFQRAYVDGKIGGLNVRAGRYNAFFADGNIYDTRADGVEISYGDKVKLTGYAGKSSDGQYSEKVLIPAADGNGFMGNYCGGVVSTKLGVVDVAAGYINYKDLGKDGVENAIWHVGAGVSFGDVALNAMYLKGDADGLDELKKLDDDGFVVSLKYKGADSAVAGSWGLFANYYDQGAQTYVAHTTDANTFDGVGFKGWGVGAEYTVAKNMVGTVHYYDTESKQDSKVDDKRLYADLVITF